MALGELRGNMNTAWFSDHRRGAFGLGRERNHLCLVNGVATMLERELIQAPGWRVYNRSCFVVS